MWVRVFPLLDSVNCEQECRAAVTSALGFTNSNYAGLQKLGAAGLRGLADQALDSLYRYCSEYDCPEIRRALLDGRLPGISADAKARYAAYTTLDKASQPALFERQLAKLGYVCRRVLCSLLSSPTIGSLAWKQAAADGAEVCLEFRRVTMHSSCTLVETYHSLQKRVCDESEKDLAHLAEHGRGLDVAIYTIKAMDSSKQVTLSSTFLKLMDLWSGDTRRREMLLPGIIEYIQAAFKLSFRCAAEQKLLRESVVWHVYASCDTERECFRLLRGFTSQLSLSRAVQRYVIKKLERAVSPSFMCKYLVYIEEHFSFPDEAAFYTFKMLFPQPAEFHATNEWNSDPRLLNLIAPRWLLAMFKGLHDSPPKGFDAVELMRKYMAKLDYGVFIRILLACPWDRGKKLAVFMLRNLSAKAKRDYLQYFRKDRQRADLNNQYKGALRVLANAFKELHAHGPMLDGKGAEQEISSGSAGELQLHF
ncbi:hypothetical protein PAPHI01_2554 [Pancytospora philotis]|nr:hypothetical protein PAPHI01_2554 [Pancytospora philotis]